MKIILGAALCVLMLNARVEAKGRYELRAKKVKIPLSGYPTRENFDLSLWDHARRRVLWKRRVTLYRRTWSRDDRALAVEILDGDWRVLVWRESFRLREFSAPSDYTMGCAWSPDDKRLLIHSGSSGSSVTNQGRLYCLKLGRWPRYKYFELKGEVVYQFAWKTRRLVWFQDIELDAIKPAKLTPLRFWRVP